MQTQIRGFRCPRCGKMGCYVIDTRFFNECGEGGERKRVRECPSCGYRFNTWEIPEDKYIRLAHSGR
ncbi:hypothetical protein J7M23_08165 [Candidatus Sumerlaeota bacterium]|nr:hypothetical protein [Candidatus Sumerlaeota bacterium]